VSDDDRDISELCIGGDHDECPINMPWGECECRCHDPNDPSNQS
jgi:hypothetical protein